MKKATEMHFFDRNRTILLVGVIFVFCGCDGGSVTDTPGVKKFRRVIASSRAVNELLSSVRDLESSRTAAPQVKGVFLEMESALSDAATYEKVHGKIVGLKSTIDELNQEVARQKRLVDVESDRLSNAKNLSPKFWNEYKLAAVQLILTMFEQLGSTTPVATEYKQFLYAFRNMLQEHGASQVVEVTVDNLPDKYLAKAIEKFRDAIGNNVVIHQAENPDKSNSHILVMGPVSDYGVAKRTAEQMGMIQFEDVARCTIEFEVDRRTLGAKFNSDEEKARFEEKQVDQQIAEVREQIAESHEDWARRRERDTLPSEADEDYFERLADLLTDEDSSAHDAAVKKLAAMNPRKIADKKLRQKIARGFRHLALTERHFEDTAIQGLVNWAGKHSVPTLVQLLSDVKLDASPAIFHGLAKYPDPRGAEAVVKLLGNFFNHNKAVACLKQMGPAAEDTLIKAVPSRDSDVCLASVELLVDVGTKKSVPILRKAVRSPNPDVKFAARAALAAIRDREQTNN